MISKFEQTALPENQIAGVQFKALKTFPDDRGFFREVIRNTDEFFKPAFAQWSHSKMAKNTVKAWHFHHRQVDWWYVGLGTLHVALIDNREESKTYRKKIEFKLGDGKADSSALEAVVRIPQGVLHGAKVLTDEAHLFYITSETYDVEDEGRLPFNSSEIDHNWGNENSLIVAANDKRVHIPKYERK